MDGEIERLEADYRRFAAAYGEANLSGDSKVANKNHDRLFALVPKLRAKGRDGEAVLRRLMKDPSPSVACWAATHSLPFAAPDALRLLDALAEERGPIGFAARMTAQEWRHGRLKIP